MTCTFFGHKDTPKEIEPTLKEVLTDLIKNKGVNNFYVGNHGRFDYMVIKNLKQLKEVYPHINYAVVLAYMPKKAEYFDPIDYDTTLYPDGLESTPPKFAIDKRNRWMIKNSDYVVCYVRFIVGGAFKYKEIAEKRGKIIINLAPKER